MKNITYASPSRLPPMVEKDLSSTISEVDENTHEVLGNDAESEDKLDQELDRIRDRIDVRTQERASWSTPSFLGHSMTTLWSSV